MEFKKITNVLLSPQLRILSKITPILWSISKIASPYLPLILELTKSGLENNGTLKRINTFVTSIFYHELHHKPYIKRKDEILKAAANPKKEDTMQILNNIVELSEKKMQCVQRQMQGEIEIFMNSNLEEMYKGMEELRASFEREIKDMEGKF